MIDKRSDPIKVMITWSDKDLEKMGLPGKTQIWINFGSYQKIDILYVNNIKWIIVKSESLQVNEVIR